MTDTSTLRQSAETLGGALPPLLAAAEQLAASVLPGSHGRRRTGQGDEFWQYRPSHAGDEARLIDWRRSARADSALYVREKEWQAAQSVTLWVDPGQSMDFTSGDHATKGETARRIALALAILLHRGGERIGLASAGLPPRAGQVQIERITAALLTPADRDHGRPTLDGTPRGARAVFVSDFLADPEALENAMTRAADRGITGALLQVLDPQEEAFPFGGRTVFRSMGGSLSHETLQAARLRDRYLERLAARKARLATLARATGWQYHLHHPDRPAASALLWLYQAMERRA